MELAQVEEQTVAEISDLTAEAAALIVTTAPQAQSAAVFMGELAARRKRVEEWFGEPKRLAHAAWMKIREREKYTLDRFDEPIRIVKMKLAEFRTKDQDRQREAELAAAKATHVVDLGNGHSVTVAPVVPEPAKIDGVSFTTHHKANVVDMKALCAAVAAGTQPETLVMPNQRVLDKMATALGAELRIPGVEVVTEERVRRQSMR